MADGEALRADGLGVGDGVEAGVGDAGGVAGTVTAGGAGAGSCVVPPSARGAGGAGAEGHRSTAIEVIRCGGMKILISADMEGATGVTWPADVLPG
ncbi:hypothetical protein AB0O63_32070, partial [Streptomyces cyaneofuscatus]|uniref:hypothetical protein n=1 Tax=Streptomyces cyaneofuscatus TaxID=66883 RepID=UPI00341C8B3C